MRVKVIERRPPAAAASFVGEGEPEHDNDAATNTPLARLANGTANAQPDGAALLLEPHIRVLELLAKGKTLSQIATGLGYALQTVKNYLTVIYSRLGGRRGEMRAGATRWR